MSCGALWIHGMRGLKWGEMKGEVYDYLGGQHWPTINLHLREGVYSQTLMQIEELM